MGISAALPSELGSRRLHAEPRSTVTPARCSTYFECINLWKGWWPTRPASQLTFIDTLPFGSIGFGRWNLTADKPILLLDPSSSSKKSSAGRIWSKIVSAVRKGEAGTVFDSTGGLKLRPVRRTIEELRVTFLARLAMTSKIAPASAAHESYSSDIDHHQLYPLVPVLLERKKVVPSRRSKTVIASGDNDLLANRW